MKEGFVFRSEKKESGVVQDGGQHSVHQCCLQDTIMGSRIHPATTKKYTWAKKPDDGTMKLVEFLSQVDGSAEISIDCVCDKQQSLNSVVKICDQIARVF